MRILGSIVGVLVRVLAIQATDFTHGNAVRSELVCDDH